MAETSTTTYMALILPTPGERLGPTWASDLNTALTTIDQHNHTSIGAQLGVAAFTVDGDINFAPSGTSYSSTNMNYLNLEGRASTVSTAITNTLYSYGAAGTKELFWIDNSGNPVQITAGGVVNSPVSSYAANIFQSTADQITTATFDLNPLAVPLDIGTNTDAAVWLVNRAGTVTITLPPAPALGRFYMIKDVNGASATYPITVKGASGTTIDGISAATGVVIESNYEAVTFCYVLANTWARV